MLYIFFLSITISISGLPIFTTVPPSLASPAQGTTFQAKCQAKGYPRPVITWSRSAVLPLPAGRTEVNQGTLTIKSLSPADSGLYDCVATNVMGAKKTRINVVVQRRSGLYIRHRLYLSGVAKRYLQGFFPTFSWRLVYNQLRV